ncbi:HAD family hydrolase [Candidatus Ozemobacteraceae bacterium]|nr:HAD family hydrolase [Candidatus Ozemobacteraceae bacterium]
MKSLRKRLHERSPSTLSQFIQAFNELSSESPDSEIPPLKRLRIAFFATFTARGLKEVLFCTSLEEGIWGDIREIPYGSGIQELLDPRSDVCRFSPEVLFLFQDLASFAGDAALSGNCTLPGGFAEWWKERWAHLRQVLETILRNIPGVLVVHNFEIPLRTPFGILENKQACGIVEAIDLVNQELRSFARENHRLFVLDYRAFCGQHGAETLSDPKMNYLADAKIRFDRFPSLAAAWLPYIRGASSLARKCLVTDLDNTLWGGVAGEDGINGIRLGPTPEGRPFWEVQKYLLGLYQRGIILAINSRNNPEDALQIIRDHPHMVLREKHFAAIRLNWNDKIANLRSLSEELHIGLDSMVFMDDDPLNCEMVRSALPEVKVVERPKDPSLFMRTLTALTDFDSLALTAEDLGKGRMYAGQRLRKEFEQSATSPEEYLRGLRMTMTAEAADAFSLPRLAQLTQKTNQFNMTTRRYQVAEVEAMSKRSDWGVLSVQVADAFGDNGIIGAMIFQQLGKRLRIDTFLLSCRVIGRNIEDAMLALLLEEAKKRECDTLVGEFIPTAKNAPARDFFKTRHFAQTGERDSCELWELSVPAVIPFPDYIQRMEKA